jgi:hypothetical protein
VIRAGDRDPFGPGFMNWTAIGLEQRREHKKLGKTVYSTKIGLRYEPEKSYLRNEVQFPHLVLYFRPMALVLRAGADEIHD